MSSSSTSRSTSNFQQYSNPNSSTGLKIRYNTKTLTNVGGTTRRTNTKTSLKSNFQSGKINLEQENELEDITVNPCNKKLFLISFILPCIGFYGFTQMKNQNRREKLWSIFMILYAFMMTIILIIIVVLFAVFY